LLSKLPLISRSLWSRLPMGQHHALGALVEPDVYCRKANDEASMAGAVQSAAALVSMLSDASQAMFATLAASRVRSRVVAQRAHGHRGRGAASCATAMRRSKRRGCGGYTGTATAPAYKQPKNAVM